MDSPRPFRFGVINEQLLPPAEWLSHVRHIEDLGYSTLLIRDHLGVDQALAMPSVLIGSLDQIAADMLARRRRYGLCSCVLSDQQAEDLAPLVERLGGI